MAEGKVNELLILSSAMWLQLKNLFTGDAMS